MLVALPLLQRQEVGLPRHEGIPAVGVLQKDFKLEAEASGSGFLQVIPLQFPGNVHRTVLPPHRIEIGIHRYQSSPGPDHEALSVQGPPAFEQELKVRKGPGCLGFEPELRQKGLDSHHNGQDCSV